MNIGIISDKGGVGKTMTAVHLAGYLGEVYGREEVELVDGDPNESVFDYYDRGEGELGIEVSKPPGGDKPHEVFDSQGRLSQEDIEWLADNSDLLVVPSFVDLMSLQVTQKVLLELREIVDVPYRVLFTMVPWWEARVRSVGMAEFKKSGHPCFEQVIENRRAYVLSSDLGVLARDLPGRVAKAAWNDYVAVGDEMVSVVNSLETA